MTTSTLVQEARINQPPFVNNLLSNPGFEIWQRGAGPFVGSNDVYAADEWVISNGSTASRTTDCRFGQYALTSSVSGATLSVVAGIERYTSLEGQWLTFSVWVKTTIAGTAAQIFDHTAAGNQGGTSINSHSGSGQWEQLTAVKEVRIGLTPNTIDVNWPHNWGLLVSVFIGVVGTNSFTIDGAVCAAGYFPEGLPYVPLNPAEDMERCSRFYQAEPATYDATIFSGYVTSGNVYDIQRPFPTQMSAVPTVTYLTGGQSRFPAGAPTYFVSSVNGMMIRKVANSTGEGYHWSRQSMEVT